MIRIDHNEIDNIGYHISSALESFKTNINNRIYLSNIDMYRYLDITI
jgi:hypothetical protein